MLANQDEIRVGEVVSPLNLAEALAAAQHARRNQVQRVTLLDHIHAFAGGRSSATSVADTGPMSSGA